MTVEKNLELWNLYFLWCKTKGLKPSHGDSLEMFINLITRD